MNRRERRRLAKQAPAAPAHSLDPAPGLAEARRRLQAGDPAGAALACRENLAADPNQVDSLHLLGVALRLAGDPAAVEALRRAVRLRPGDPDALVNLANALQEHGQAAEAREVAARLLAAHPALPDAWAVHAGLKTFAAGDADLARMEALLARTAGEGEAEIVLGFALGKAWMDVGDPDRAFAHLSRANRLKRATFAWDVEAEVRRLAAIPRGIEALKPRLSGLGHPSDRPVFVVGLPRSGATLVEQILASHADIAGGGELDAFQAAMAQAFTEAGMAPRDGRGGRVRVDPLARLDPARLGRAYLDRTDPLARGRARLVDKMPDNFQNLGLIALALPNARIIHCRRDPIDTALSCFATPFTAWKPFAWDLVELGRYARAYRALMDCWRATLPPERFIEVAYEEVLADLEGQARRLVGFCGLDWDPACLRFHETRRPVLTASVNQVRRPLYPDSQGRWRAYEAHLQPLIEALQGGAPPPAFS